MAKRFTDTDKWNHSWFRKLSPKMKCVWSYLCDRCDHAGIWIADYESLSFHIGEDVTRDEIESQLQGKIIPIKHDKYLIQAFIDFQYGELNPTNRVHKSVISRLEKEGASKPLRSPLEGVKDKDKDKDKDKVSSSNSVAVQNINQEVFDAWNVWQETLAEFKIPSSKISMPQENAIARAIKTIGFENVLLALEGLRYERPGRDFNPRDYLSLDRVLKNDKTGTSRWERFKNMALAAKSEKETTRSQMTEDEMEIQAFGRKVSQ